MAFGRAAPGQVVADAIEAMIGDLVDAVVGSFGVWLGAAEQLEDLGVHRVREPARLPPSRVPTQVPQGDDGVRQVAFRCQL